MDRVIILYPEAFNCYSKFHRKISKIIQNMDNYLVIYPDDYNGFIINFFKENHPNIDVIQNYNWKNEEVTHGIVFDDGEEFIEETTFLKSLGIPLRVIRILITRVINVKKEVEFKTKKSTPFYEYIGRGSYWGNPYSMYDSTDDRDEVIRKYRYDFEFEKFANKKKSEVYKLMGKRLGCFCKPEACHGDILADYLNSLDDGK